MAIGFLAISLMEAIKKYQKTAKTHYAWKTEMFLGLVYRMDIAL
jgi:hypothetical protein